MFKTEWTLESRATQAALTIVVSGMERKANHVFMLENFKKKWTLESSVNYLDLWWERNVEWRMMSCLKE